LPHLKAGAAEATALARQSEPMLIEQALKSDPAVVVLGDPGAGKSTLLKVLALALAQQTDGPLPILLPLNAYARHLRQQGEVNLGDFLGHYYAARQQKLERVGELFNAALAGKQAVILLDGLDEVQADRAYLVRLVQDFVAEYIPHPTGDPDAGAVLGNRAIVTSRIVGYQEAPLAGRQWRSYTLTDFSRADIEQFVGQWTLAFAVSVQGDTEPARQAAERERKDLLAAISSRPSVERLASNPLLLTILALIKYTGVTLPEQRVKLYELYLEALIESWNRARSLDQYPVGPGLDYEETVQVLAPLALWLRRENPTAGLVTQNQLKNWLTDYYGQEWGLPRGKARQRGRDFLAGVQTYSNLLLERGEQQYGFLHLTLEEMLAAQGIAQLLDEDRPAALDIFKQYLLDPG
ncbi:MAG: NACHT domain-containing protein, partial [bacterium]|nr:NACHT domain-containing protein [bacterium]